MTTLTDPTRGASYTPVDYDRITLTPRTSRSLSCPWTSLPSLEAWCWHRRYSPIPTRSDHEYARLRKQDRLLILYHSGAVVCSGDDWQGVMHELQRFVEGGAV